jgi:hypothetical protein
MRISSGDARLLDPIDEDSSPITFANSGQPLSARHRRDAASNSLNTIVRNIWRVPDPLVFSIPSRTVTNTLSITFVLRRCNQCSAGESSNVSNSTRSLTRHSVALGRFASLLRSNKSNALPALARLRAR